MYLTSFWVLHTPKAGQSTFLDVVVYIWVFLVQETGKEMGRDVICTKLKKQIKR